MLVLNALMYGSLKSVRMFENVQPPSMSLKAPTRTSPAGRNRKRIVYAKNGSVAIHANERRLRPARPAGRSASATAFVVMA
jgi:hypothetical protein